MRTLSGVKNYYRFFKGYYIVIVEGPDDFVYWRNYFPNEISGLKLKVKPVGGRLAVEKFVKVIIEKNTPYIAILDSDYDLLNKKSFGHIRVIETGAYSIENLMACKCKVSKIVSNYTKSDKDYSLDYEKALDHYDECVFPLMCADYLLFNSGTASDLMRCACLKYLKDGKYVKEFSKRKILGSIKKLKITDFEQATQNLRSFKPRFHSNGHFFFSFVCAFISSSIKKAKNIPNIPNLTFFNHLSEQICPNCTQHGFLGKCVQNVKVAIEDLMNLVAPPAATPGTSTTQ